MRLPSFSPRLLATLVTLSFGAAIGTGTHSLRADDAPKPDPAVTHAQDLARRRAHNQAIAQEISVLPEGIHKLSDGSVCIKSGPGMAHVHDDGRGCGTGCNSNPAPVGDDGDLMAGVVVALFMQPKEADKLGIGPALASKIKDAYCYMDYEHTNPSTVLKLYNQYAKLPEGKDKTDAEKAVMDRVRTVGQAYIDAETKKVKDVKALVTPDQSRGLRVLGAKMIRPFEKPIA